MSAVEPIWQASNTFIEASQPDAAFTVAMMPSISNDLTGQSSAAAGTEPADSKTARKTADDNSRRIMGFHTSSGYWCDAGPKGSRGDPCRPLTGFCSRFGLDVPASGQPQPAAFPREKLIA